MQLGEAWARPLEATWYVQSKERAEVLETRLGLHLDSEDGLLIQQVETEAVLLNTSLRWFRNRHGKAGERRMLWRSRCVRCLKQRRPDRKSKRQPVPGRCAPPRAIASIGGRRCLPQGCHFRKLAMSRSPSVWLFSGWNCVPAMLSAPTIAVTGPP